MSKYIELLRIRHYVKNLFVFAPLFFSFSFHNLQNVVFSFLAFILFSLAASGIYILNDIYDIEEDKQHPIKKKRGLASGKVKISTAILIVCFLLSMVLVGAILLNKNLFIVLSIYIIINYAYSVKLKNYVVIDIAIISLGFVLRIFAGAVVINVSVSMWIIIITFLLAIFLAIAKRREDLILLSIGQNTRKNVDDYNIEFINSSMVLMAAVIIVSYILFTASPEVQLKFRSSNLYLTSFFVIVGILKYMQLVFVAGERADPTELIYQSKFLQIVIVCWLLCFYLISKA